MLILSSIDLPETSLPVPAADPTSASTGTTVDPTRNAPYRCDRIRQQLLQFFCTKTSAEQLASYLCVDGHLAGPGKEEAWSRYLRSHLEYIKSFYHPEIF